LALRWLRIDNENLLFYEVIDFVDKNHALHKLTYYQTRDSYQRFYYGDQKEILTYQSLALVSRWNIKKETWESDNSDYNRNPLNDLLFSEPVYIKKGDKLVIKDKDRNIQQYIKMGLSHNILEILPIYGNIGMLGNNDYQNEKIDSFSNLNSKL